MDLKKTDNRGFSLLELMVAMAIASIVLASIYRVYYTQQMASVTQKLVIEMQQNARSAMTLMKREIRMAGFKPAATDGQDNDNPTAPDPNDIDDDDDDNDYPGGFPGFLVAEKDTIQFTMDLMPNPVWCTDAINNDGDSDTDEMDECFSNGKATDLNENIKYSLSGTNLMRTDAKDGIDLVLAYDIEAVAFAYAFDSTPGDDDSNLDTDIGGQVIWANDSDGDQDLDQDIAGNPLAVDVSLSTIRAVKIWLLARTSHPIRGEVDTHTYQVGDQVFAPGTYDPAYRRTLQITTVYCRNTRF